MATGKSVANSKMAKKTATKSGKTAAKKTPAKPKAKAMAAKAKTATKKTAPKAKAKVKAKVKVKVKASATVKKVVIPKTKAAVKKPAAAKAKASSAKSTKPEKSAKVTKSAKVINPESAKPTFKKKSETKPKAEFLHGFAVKDYVVYPSHGVGQIIAVEEHEIGDISLRVFVVVFDKEKMTLRVPIEKADTSGMRRLSSAQKMEKAITTLKGRARTRRVMWSRRAQEYDAKLNSGDPVSIAEVVRDLHRDESQPDQSYSERQMYEAALERLAREFAAVENTDTEQAAEKLENVLRAA